ncbi:LysR family transcriptional regulator [Novosphingobium sp.]|uniref:LysR family transcriptional regulator n=1 Tax=Novosphingobium sp. TaxID=1874826 RepID=UPI00262E69BC|nr:LysR family transcriptional regulator [Novosphingobium sp.]
MDFNAAAIFVRVAEAGGFTAAARHLAMPKSTVSKKVAALEQELGVRLLNRTTRALTLTEAGSRVLSHCREAVGHIEAAEREARSLQQEPVGQLTIAAPPAIAISAVMPAIAAFMERFPLVSLVLLSSTDLADLDEGRADVMIWAAADMPPGHAVRLVAEIEVALFASAEYVQSNGSPQTPAELSQHAAVAHTYAYQRRGFSWPLRSGDKTVDIVPVGPPRFASNDAMAVLAAIMSGHGIGGLPLAMVAAMPQAKTLVPVLPLWRASPVALGALFRDGASSSLKTRLFLDFIAAWFAKEGKP